MKPLLLVLDDWEGYIRRSACWDIARNSVEIKFLDVPVEEASDHEIRQAQYLMAVRERTALNERVFERMPGLKGILQTGGHAYHIDIDAARKRGIAIALGRRIKAPLASVPELTFAMVLGLMHKIYQGDRMIREGGWGLVTGRTLAARRLGLLGMGRHGTRVAYIAKTAFNMEVVAWDRTGVYKEEEEVTRLPLDELLATSDVVSIHLRLSPESTGLIDSGRLAKMKAGSILINTSRGAIVDEPALIAALRDGRLSGAGLDVFVHEPLAEDSPLRSLENVILTPHIGWTVEEVFEEFVQIACAQIAGFLNETIPVSELL